jgi:hypothetical protein
MRLPSARHFEVQRVPNKSQMDTETRPKAGFFVPSGVQRIPLQPGSIVSAILRLALKAQSQCRATLETLAVIKNPPQLSFVRQANIGHAVRVNNGPPIAALPGAGENENHPSKLLEAPHVERLDSRTASIQSDLVRRVKPWER